MGREETRGGGNESVRKEKRKKKKEDKKWESLLWERLKVWKKILFPMSEEDNIYKSYVLCEREIVFQKIYLENNL